MKKLLLAASAAAALAFGAAQSAAAATIIPISTTNGSFSVASLAAGDDLRNNQDYSSRSTAYGLYEGQVGNQSSILLHYDRSGGITATGRVSGSFQLQLAANETLGDIFTSSAGLYNSDPSNGVQYQRDLGWGIGVTLLRGLEPGALPGFGDWINVFDNGSKLYTISYDFRNDGLTQDQARFMIDVSAVPEPATWAMMITGFGLAGTAIRRRRSTFAVAA